MRHLGEIAWWLACAVVALLLVLWALGLLACDRTAPGPDRAAGDPRKSVTGAVTEKRDRSCHGSGSRP